MHIPLADVDDYTGINLSQHSQVSTDECVNLREDAQAQTLAARQRDNEFLKEYIISTKTTSSGNMWTYNDEVHVDGDDSVELDTDVHTDETKEVNLGIGTQVGYRVDGDDDIRDNSNGS